MEYLPSLTLEGVNLVWTGSQTGPSPGFSSLAQNPFNLSSPNFVILSTVSYTGYVSKLIVKYKLIDELTDV